jgi:hypothetical protein
VSYKTKGAQGDEKSTVKALIMAKHKTHPEPSYSDGRRSWFWFVWLPVALVVAGVGIVVVREARKPYPEAKKKLATSTLSRASDSLPLMEVNRAVMVTVELDFGSPVPTIAEALKQVERRYRPEDGNGRTFAILDAYGEPAPEGKLHLSMHVSTEKPGVGALVFRPTGKVLWESRIVAGTNTSSFTGKNLLILLGDETGHTITVDGSNNPKSILDARIKHQDLPVSAFWPEETEREVTFIYSACGCPVKVMARRVGDRTIRTKDLPVIFPDDPSVVRLINRLMGW